MLSGCGVSLQCFLLLQSAGSRAGASVVVVMGLVALQHVESSWPRDQTCVCCIGRQTLFLPRFGKGVLFKAVYCHPAYLTYMQSTS